MCASVCLCVCFICEMCTATTFRAVSVEYAQSGLGGWLAGWMVCVRKMRACTVHNVHIMCIDYALMVLVAVAGGFGVG